MEKCCLCQNADADKLGSHSVPYSLIKSCINYNSDGRRDKEFITRVDQRIDYPIYVGRSIIPEKEDEARARYRLADAGRANNNPYVKDNVLCTNCEKRFSVLESLFADKIMSKLDNLARTNIREYYLSETEALIAKIYALSLFWRLWAFQTPWRFELGSVLKSKIQTILDSCLQTDHSTTISNAQQIVSSIQQIPIFILHNDELVDQSTAPITINLSKNPYLFCANRFIFLCYPKASGVRSSISTIFGCRDIIQQSGYRGSLSNQFSILLLNVKATSLILHNIYGGLAKGHMELVRSRVNYLYRKKWGKWPHKVAYEMVHRRLFELGYYTGDIPSGNFDEVINEVVAKFEPGFLNWLISQSPDSFEPFLDKYREKT